MKKTLARFEAPDSLVRVALTFIRNWLEKNRRDGAVCPACEQVVKVYRRKLNASMGRALIAMHQGTYMGEFVHLFRFLGDRGVPHSDAALLRFWGLLEEQDGEREDGNPRAGFYTITPRGRLFAQGKIAMRSHGFFHNGACLHLDYDKLVGIRAVLGSKFDYDELMAA